MVAIGPALGDTNVVGEPLMQLLKDTYEAAKQEAEKVRQNANTNIEEYFKGYADQSAIEPGDNPQIEAGETITE